MHRLMLATVSHGRQTAHNKLANRYALAYVEGWPELASLCEIGYEVSETLGKDSNASALTLKE